MLNQMIDAIALKLEQHFGQGYTVYRNPVAQEDAATPSFLLYMMPSTHQQQRGRRIYRALQFAVHYKPQTPDIYTDMHEVAEELIPLLEILEVDEELYRGSDIRFEIVEGMLIWSITYAFYLMKEAEEIDDAMEHLEQE